MDEGHVWDTSRPLPTWHWAMLAVTKGHTGPLSQRKVVSVSARKAALRGLVCGPAGRVGVGRVLSGLRGRGMAPRGLGARVGDIRSGRVRGNRWGAGGGLGEDSTGQTGGRNVSGLAPTYQRMMAEWISSHPRPAGGHRAPGPTTRSQASPVNNNLPAYLLGSICVGVDIGYCCHQD